MKTKISDLKSIAKEFGIEIANATQEKNSVLSQVYISNNGYVLRSRKMSADTLEKFAAEEELLKKVRPLTTIQFPDFLSTRDGKKYIVKDDLLWTAHLMIKGDILCYWWELYKLSADVEKNIFVSLRRLHDATRGKLSPTGNLVFIHGDYHPGNIIFKNGEVVALIDTDWIRSGHYLEDFAYTLMMFLRDYRKEKFEFSQEKFDTYCRWYGAPEEDIPLLKERLLFYAEYDAHVFSAIPESPNKQMYIRYQQSVIEDFSKRFSQ